MTRTKKYLLGLMGAGLLALPLAMPSTAQADDFRISLNLGGDAPVYYSQPAVQRVVYRQPAPVIVKEVYRPPVQRIVYREAPRRVVVVERPHRVVVREVYRGRGHGNHYAYGHGRWDNHDRYVAWR